MRVARGLVLAYRVVAQGLDRAGAGELPGVLALGLQDTSGYSARLALVARGAPEPDPALLSVAWTVRGAPHLHHTDRLPALAAALWPLSDADARSRLSWQRARADEAGTGPLAALGVVARALREVVTGPMRKGAASTALTGAVPRGLSSWCAPCGTRHVDDALFRLAALPAGLRLEPGATPARLVPIGDRPGVPERAEGTGELVRDYLRYLGPARPAEVAAFLNSTPGQLRAVWPDDLAEVEVAGRPAWLPADALGVLDALRAGDHAGPAEGERAVRLLPPSDPFLQARDRALVLPDAAGRKALWTSVGRPGAVLVAGEPVGIWRPRMSGRTLRLTIRSWGGLTKNDRAALATEANSVAAVRGVDEADVSYE